MWEEAKLYSAMAWGLARYQFSPRAGNAAANVQRQFEQREEHFLELCRRVLAQPSHPYSGLFAYAGCSYGDLEAAVRRKGLEASLRELLRSGVYLTIDEFRGRTPVVRSGRVIPSRRADWSNRAVQGLLAGSTSGSSTGQRLFTVSAVDYWRYRENYELLEEREFGYQGFERILLAPLLPGWGISFCMRQHRLGRPYGRWFAVGGGAASNAHYRWLTRYMVAQSRLLGGSLPYPEYLGDDGFLRVAEGIAKSLPAGCFVAGVVSALTRVADAASSRGISLEGAHFMVSGEPLTAAKRRLIESSGARVFPRYLTSDYGYLGFSCRSMNQGNCMHVLQDAVALTQPEADGYPGDPQALFVTSLHPAAPWILINAELGDRAVIEPADCDCEFSRAGLRLRVRDITPTAKLTGLGATFIVTDLVELIDEALPARFGGKPGDFQMVETEGKAQTEIVLRVSPRVARVSESEIRSYFLTEVRRLFGGSLTVNEWRYADALRIEWEDPRAGATGKVAPVELLREPYGGAGART